MPASFTVWPQTFPPCQGLSLWERWHGASRDGEGEPVSRSAALSQKAALQMQFGVATPNVKMCLERPAGRDKREIKNNFPLNMPRA